MADNNEKKQQAQFLYMAGGKTQKEIADLVGVSERTIYSWVHQLSWDKLTTGRSVRFVLSCRSVRFRI